MANTYDCQFMTSYVVGVEIHRIAALWGWVVAALCIDIDRTLLESDKHSAPLK
eukprot:m.107038 g.107038  ORF g.107038 m.107038 type:complete len:53 (+) comp12728_c0_seq1:1810-1968(+)